MHHDCVLTCSIILFLSPLISYVALPYHVYLHNESSRPVIIAEAGDRRAFFAIFLDDCRVSISWCCIKLVCRKGR